MLGARDNQRNFLNPAPIDFVYDFNRDARVNASDMLIARDHQTHFLNALQLIAVPDGKASARGAALEEAGNQESSSGRLAWLYELDTKGRSAEKVRPDEDLTDRVLAARGT